MWSHSTRGEADGGVEGGVDVDVGVGGKRLASGEVVVGMEMVGGVEGRVTVVAGGDGDGDGDGDGEMDGPEQSVNG
jgi:hypothetical protein